MKCDSCGDEIGNLGDDWVALGKSGDICTVCAAEEIEKLRAEVEQLREEARWRKWPDERPNTKGRFHVTNDGLCVDWNYFNILSGEWGFDMTTWWRPIGKLPETEEGGAGDE